MSEYYGTVEGNKGEAHRGGTKHSGLTTYAASWDGAIRVRLYFDEVGKCHRYVVSQATWQGAGVDEEIATGVLGKKRGERT
jgi:hypothetical protein